MKTNGFDVQKCQHGWLCGWFYNVTTADQFSDVSRSAQAGSRWMFLAIFRAWREARKLERIERAKPGQRESKGWAA
jgi:hypothetical protein